MGGTINGRLDLSNMPTLFVVCVWETPFPPEDKVGLVDTTDSPNVYFVSCSATSINASEENNLTTIYPNPANDIINIEVENPTHAILEIHTLSGTILYSRALHSKQENIDVLGYKPGLYFIRVLNNEDIYTQKILIE